MTREDFIYPDEKPDGTILGYLDEDGYIEALEKYADYLESKSQKSAIPIVRLSFDEFKTIATNIEIHIQKNDDYKTCIATGHFSDRFRQAYKKYLKSNEA